MKFICDDMLGKLAKLLRALGFDAYYQKDIKDHQLLRTALDQERIIVTKDKKLGEVRTIPKYILIGADKPFDQLEELRQKAGLVINMQKVFRHCIECNTFLEKIEREEVNDKLSSYALQ